jgi:hypothetical protein
MSRRWFWQRPLAGAPAEVAGARTRVSNLPPEGQLDAWVFSCPRCGKEYRVGIDAGIMTIEETLEMMRTAGATVAGSLGSGPRDDMLFAIGDVAPERLGPLQEQAMQGVQTIKDSLASGQERCWYCKRCGPNNGTYPYPV